MDSKVELINLTKELAEKRNAYLLRNFKWLALISIVLVFVILGIAFLVGHELPSFSLFVQILFGAGILFPLCLLGIVRIRWAYDSYVFRRVFSNKPFNQLLNIGFEVKKKIYLKSSDLVDFSFIKMKDGFTIEAKVDTQKDPNFVWFNIPTDTIRCSNQELKAYQQKLKSYGATVNGYEVDLKYHYQKHDLKSVAELDSQLLAVIEIMKLMTFKPYET